MTAPYTDSIATAWGCFIGKDFLSCVASVSHQTDAQLEIYNGGTSASGSTCLRQSWKKTHLCCTWTTVDRTSACLAYTYASSTKDSRSSWVIEGTAISSFDWSMTHVLGRWSWDQVSLSHLWKTFKALPHTVIISVPSMEEHLFYFTPQNHKPDFPSLITALWGSSVILPIPQMSRGAQVLLRRNHDVGFSVHTQG